MEGGVNLTEQLTTVFSGLAADLIPALVAIAGVAIGVYAIILGFRFAKKIFSQVAR